MDRLRPRNVRVKRSLALREFALGVEALERFVRREPLRRVHECVFGVLALESETVDPRLKLHVGLQECPGLSGGDGEDRRILVRRTGLRRSDAGC